MIHIELQPTYTPIIYREHSINPLWGDFSAVGTSKLYIVKGRKRDGEGEGELGRGRGQHCPATLLASVSTRLEVPAEIFILRAQVCHVLQVRPHLQSYPLAPRGHAWWRARVQTVRDCLFVQMQTPFLNTPASYILHCVVLYGLQTYHHCESGRPELAWGQRLRVLNSNRTAPFAAEAMSTPETGRRGSRVLSSQDKGSIVIDIGTLYTK